MLRKSAMAVVLALFIAAIPIAAHAEEPLFDTEALARYVEKGIEHLMAKKYDAAITEFTEATYITPNAEAFYYLGYAYYMKGKNRNDAASRRHSMENFTRAYEIDPNFTPTRFQPEEGIPAKRGGAAAGASPEPDDEAPAQAPEDIPAEPEEGPAPPVEQQ